MNGRSLIILLTLVLFSITVGHQTSAQRKRQQPQSRTPQRESPTPKLAKSHDDDPGYYWEQCDVFKRLPNNDISREEALKRAYKIVTNYPKWYSYLPPCPQTVTEIRSHSLFTGFEQWFDRQVEVAFTISCFHPGADMCFRSKLSFPSEAFETDPLANYHAQQCCYSKSGNLITSGPSAGTPDFISSSLDDSAEESLEGKGHRYYDVLPWTKLSVNEYHVTWPPNQGANKPFRSIVPAKGTTTVGANLVFGENGPDIAAAFTKHIWHPTHLRVAKGDVLRLKVVKGQVKLAEGVESGPEGIKSLSKEQQLALVASAMLSPVTDPDSPVGSLIATVYTGDYDVEDMSLDQESLTAPFYIGAEKQIEIIMDGYLMLTVNDAMPDDNAGYFIVEIQRIR